MLTKVFLFVGSKEEINGRRVVVGLNNESKSNPVVGLVNGARVVVVVVTSFKLTIKIEISKLSFSYIVFHLPDYVAFGIH